MTGSSLNVFYFVWQRTHSKQEFRNRFSREPEAYFLCPGRVNLIGEHIDYNGGKVLPCAYAGNIITHWQRIPIRQFVFNAWTSRRQLTCIFNHHILRPAMNGLITPLMLLTGSCMIIIHIRRGPFILWWPADRAGLSSSASMKCSPLFAMNEIFALGISLPAIASCPKKQKKFHWCELWYHGSICGSNGKKTNAILLDCDTLAYEYVPFSTGKYSLVIINTNKTRTLADSKYNERFAECGAALKLLKQEMKNARHLCDIDPDVFEQYNDCREQPYLKK